MGNDESAAGTFGRSSQVGAPPDACQIRVGQKPAGDDLLQHRSREIDRLARLG